MKENEILDIDLSSSNSIRRRKLLPIWIKIFLWLFMIFGAIVPVGLIIGLLGMNFHISLYGIETNEVFSIVGIVLISIFAIKGAVSFGLWTEKEWAVNLAIIDGILGILVCLFVMLLPIINSNGDFIFRFKFELIILIPYLLKMIKLKPKWLSAKNGN